MADLQTDIDSARLLAYRAAWLLAQGQPCSREGVMVYGHANGSNEDECGSGLACTQPALCPESYCCPVSGPSTSAFCQPETRRAKIPRRGRTSPCSPPASSGGKMLS